MNSVASVLNLLSRAIVFAAMAMTLSCKKKSETDIAYESGDVIETSKNYTFPIELKKVIDDEYVAFMKTQGPPFDIKSAEELLLQVPREYLDLEILFRPLSEGYPLTATRFLLPRGGGTIDMKDIIKGEKGSFFVNFKFKKTTAPEQEIQRHKVYFLSQSQKRKISNETYGSGCNVFMDVTNFINSSSEKGVQVNATQQRYVSVLSGIYYFVAFESEKIYLAAAQLIDSRYPQLVCDRKASL